MNSTKFPTVLVLGAQGMVGHTVFHYLIKNFIIYGTVTDNKERDFIHFIAGKDKLELLHKRLGTIDYIINCIGILPNNKDIQLMQLVNSEFPHELTKFAEDINANVIHISSDAVFMNGANKVYEDSPTSPADYYGKTKLQGESNSKNVINIRTSFLGLDSVHHKGLLEFANKEEHLVGYTNQNWSGCTTLQFAQLCEDIISNNRFTNLRKISPIYHFAPIRNVSKHDIIRAFLKLSLSTKELVKAEGKPVTRSLVSKYSKELHIKAFTSDVSKSLQELIAFENNKHG